MSKATERCSAQYHHDPVDEEGPRTQHALVHNTSLGPVEKEVEDLRTQLSITQVQLLINKEEPQSGKATIEKNRRYFPDIS
jgi:hypothetical protein